MLLSYGSIAAKRPRKWPRSWASIPKGSVPGGSASRRAIGSRKHRSAARERLSPPTTGYFKKNFGHPIRTPDQRFQRIDAMKTDHPIRLLCEALEVSTSGYYDWFNRQTQPGPRAQENARLLQQIIQIHRESRQT